MKHESSGTRVVAIIPAAGTGTRAQRAGEAGLPKQYRPLSGVPMVKRAVQALLVDDRVSQVRVAVTPGDTLAADILADMPRTLVRQCGGQTRDETVLKAIGDAALGEQDWVLVHDAARPGLPADALKRLLDVCLGADRGGLLAMPVADTVKQAGESVEGACTASATVSREGLWLAQTPQLFKATELIQALTHCRAAGVNVTDEASAMEALGHRPLLVQGSWRNAKVTLPDDFAWVESWL